MTRKHLNGALKVCKRASLNAGFSCDSDMWDEWIEVFEDAMDRYVAKPEVKRARATSDESSSRGVKVEMKCHCGNLYKARVADLKRGWGKSCSKSCAATRRSFGRPAGKRVI
jgi:hypothetical protein